jgi:hypothetical protein
MSEADARIIFLIVCGLAGLGLLALWGTVKLVDFITNWWSK